MNKIKIRDKRTNAIKEVFENIVSDFIGTGNFEIYVENKLAKTIDKKSIVREPFDKKTLEKNNKNVEIQYRD